MPPHAARKHQAPRNKSQGIPFGYCFLCFGTSALRTATSFFHFTVYYYLLFYVCCSTLPLHTKRHDEFREAVTLLVNSAYYGILSIDIRLTLACFAMSFRVSGPCYYFMFLRIWVVSKVTRPGLPFLFPKKSRLSAVAHTRGSEPRVYPPQSLQSSATFGAPFGLPLRARGHRMGHGCA